MSRATTWSRSGTVALAALALTSAALAAPSQAAPDRDASTSSASTSATERPGKSPGKNKADKRIAKNKLAKKLVRKADGDSAFRHLRSFQRIADRNDGNRAAGTPGYEASVDYVARLLRQSGYLVRTPSFTYDEAIGPDGTLVVGEQTFDLGLLAESIPSPEGGTTAELVVVPEEESTGCEPADFDNLDVDGKIAVIRRGACTFLIKAQNAAEAGAAQVVITNNEGGSDLLNGTLGEAAPVPVGYTDAESGDAIVQLDGATATATPSTEIRTSTTKNVIAETRKGRTDNVVMAGAHLDSVNVGAGINDNGSGSAGLLEVALELGGKAKVKNAVRFAWWGAEELGLLGAEAYVDGLSPRQQLDIALYLNFDMIGSPNAAYFVYDGDDSDAEGAGPGPYGSAQIERLFNRFLTKRVGVPTRGTDFSGRSDYGPFIAVGIASGGLFSGAEGIKTDEEAALWGGEAGVAYDPCYHSACDDLGNVDRTAFDRNIDAVAWSVGRYARFTQNVSGQRTPQKRAQAARSVGGHSAVDPQRDARR